MTIMSKGIEPRLAIYDIQIRLNSKKLEKDSYKIKYWIIETLSSIYKTMDTLRFVITDAASSHLNLKPMR